MRGKKKKKDKKNDEAQNLENKRAIIYSQRTTKDLCGEINI